ncbi:MAG: hypothetical protein PUJ06_08650 [Stecheria intestinalis]|nr:hypothetical protein [Stecheria intestinalis]
MQDRYAGDIGDFGKIGLLKALQAQGLSIGVNWYLVEPMDTERKSDGTYKQEDGKYLIPEKLQVCDTLLAEKLTKIAKSDHRSIRSLEQGNFILNARYYSEPVSVAGREEWHKKALDLLNDLDIVFVDPDNGMLVKSVGKKSVKSVKYTFYEEVRDYVRRGQSVLIYNHRSRKQETQYFHEICYKLQEATGITETDILKITFPKCSVRDYLAVPASMEQREKIETAFTAMERGVWGENGMCRIPR